MKSIVVFNNKGGVGKTTFVCNLSAYLALNMGKKVLVVDADPQCNATVYSIPTEQFNDIYIKKKVPVLHFQLHSSDFKIGATPYVKNKKELVKFYNMTEQIFDYVMNKKHCKSVGVSEVD